MFVMTSVYQKMARTHARTKGKSGSTRPVNTNLSFVKYKKKEVEALIVKLVKDDDKKPTEVGLILRDTYGIPSIKLITGRSISKILEENKLSLPVPEDLAALIVKVKKLKKHLEINTRDTHNKRGLILIESKIRRLIKYYQKSGKLENKWSY